MEASLIHTQYYTYRKLQYLKMYENQTLMIPIRPLLHLGRSGYSCCCHFYLVLVLLRHCHRVSAIHPVHLQCNRSILCFLLTLSNEFEDPNGTMYGKSLIPNASTKRCPYSRPFVTLESASTAFLIACNINCNKASFTFPLAFL